MTWPMLFGVLALMSYGLVDTAFIGQLGTLPLAAQGFTLPISMVIIGLQVGLGIATTSLISRVLGKQEEKKAHQLGGLVIIIGAIGVAIICGIIWLLQNPILALLDAPNQIYPIIHGYWPYWLFCSWSGAMLYFSYSLCRSHGNTLLPGILMVGTSLLNIALDPLFIFYFKLGIKGAALATTTAFFIGICIIYPLIIRRGWISFHWKGFPIFNSAQSLLHIMAPAMLSQLLPPISSILATKLVAAFGTEAVAAWAVGSRLNFFAIVCVLSLTMSLPPMIGRMVGSQQYSEIKTLVNISVEFVLILQVLIAILLFLFSTPIAHLLTNESDVVTIVHEYLTWIPVSLGSLGVCMIMVSVCNALGLPMRALFISALRLFICYLPFLWVGAHFLGLSGLFIGAMIGNFGAGGFAWLLYQQAIKKIVITENKTNVSA